MSRNIGPVKALHLHGCTIRNPAVIINDEKIVFSVEMSQGSYLEFYGNDNYTLCDSKGEKIMKAVTEGNVPLLLKGKTGFCSPEIERKGRLHVGESRLFHVVNLFELLKVVRFFSVG